MKRLLLSARDWIKRHHVIWNMLTNQPANQQRSSKETLRSPRSILRNPLKPKSGNESSSETRLYVASGSTNNPDPRPRSVLGLETRRLSLTDSDTSHGAARTRHSVADLRTLIRNGFSINPNDLTGSLSKSGSRIWSSGSIPSGSGGMLDLDGCELEEVDSGVGEDPWCQYKSLIQKKKHLIFEEHTSWLNNVLTRRNYQPVTNLCRSVRDGVTLVNLVQILTNAPVAGVCRQPVQQTDRVENLQNCIRHLELHDVDTQGVTGVDLADGNLKSTLILMNNLRKKYENYQAYPPRQSTETCVNGNGSQGQQRTPQIYNQYHQPSPQLSGSNKAPAQLANCNQSSSPVQLPTSVQFSIATSQSVNARNGAYSPHRTTPQSQLAYNPGSPSHRQDTQPTSSQSYQPHVNLLPGVIMDESPPARPPLPQDVIRSSPKMTNITQHENHHDLQMTSQPVPCSQTNELWAVHCRQAQYRQPTTSDAYRPPLTTHRPNGPTSHRPLVSDGCGLPISDSCRRLGPIITAQSVSQSMTNPSLAYTGRSTSVTPSVLSNALSKSSQFLDSATVPQERTTNQGSIATKSRSSEQRSLPPKLFGHFNSGYEHDGTELIVPPKPRQTQEVAANQNKMAYVPSHPSERPNCVPRLPAQMPNLPSHVGVQQPNHRMSAESPSHQPPPIYNPPPQYTRTYIQRQPQSDKSAKSSQGHPAQTIQSATSNASLHQACNNAASYPNSSQASNQRPGRDYANGPHTQMTPSPAHRSTRPSPQQPNSHGVPTSVTVTPVTMHRAVPANGRASPQGQSSTPASQSPCHDKMLTAKCSQQNFVNVDHVTHTAKYSSQVPVHTYQGDTVKGTHDGNIKNTDSAFIGGQIPPSSVYPTNGTSMGRAACIDFPEEQAPQQGGAWTKPSSPRYNQGTTLASAITLQQDVEALYSVVRKHRLEQMNPQMAQNRNDIDKANNKQETTGNKSLPSPTRASNHGMPPPDADDWNSDDSSITPPLPPLSPSNSPTPPGSPPKMQQHTGRVLEMPSKHRKGRRSGSSARSYEMGWRRSGPGRAAYRTHARTRIPVTRNVNDIDSVDHCSTSNLSDGDDWEDVITSNEVQKIHQQMEGLEMMYTEILKILGLDKEYIPGSRRSISSLSSISRSGTRRTRSNAFSHRTSREIRNMNKRFNRLEAHVVTLARSVAHLSSEMYTQNALREELDEIRRDLKQLKKERHQHHSPEGANVPGTGLMAGLLSAGHADSRRLTEFEKFRGWIPSITNPKRVKKLAKFFGEDRLLQYFLEKLGYQKYIKNFRAEEITILELPYMSEERLEKLGIPMGPRQRILQEAQMCFRQENFNIYIV